MRLVRNRKACAPLALIAAVSCAPKLRVPVDEATFCTEPHLSVGDDKNVTELDATYYATRNAYAVPATGALAEELWVTVGVGSGPSHVVRVTTAVDGTATLANVISSATSGNICCWGSTTRFYPSIGLLANIEWTSGFDLNLFDRASSTLTEKFNSSHFTQSTHDVAVEPFQFLAVTAHTVDSFAVIDLTDLTAPVRVSQPSLLGAAWSTVIFKPGSRIAYLKGKDFLFRVDLADAANPVVTSIATPSDQVRYIGCATNQIWVADEKGDFLVTTNSTARSISIF